jgi:ABC-2 type transport system permease protein
LGVKELFSFRSDVVMVVLVVYTFTYAIYTPAQHAQTELRSASVAVVDEDHSHLSKRIRDTLLEPYFQPPISLRINEIDTAMDSGYYTFVINIPPEFEADILAERQPSVQVNIDATAMTQAGHGAIYIRRAIMQEVEEFIRGEDTAPWPPVSQVVRVKFNPNLQSRWFLGVMQLVNMITLLAVLLTGAALIREREHGTIEHLLVMPLTPAEIMVAKMWANGLVIAIAAFLSLKLVVQGVLGIPIAGSISLFMFGVVIHLFAVTALGVFLATLVRSMPQFGLLAFPVFMIMILISGGITPLDSMPEVLQLFMQLAPSTHFVSFAQAVLYRGADLNVVWQDLAAILFIGMVFFIGALIRFRKMVSEAR